MDELERACRPAIFRPRALPAAAPSAPRRPARRPDTRSRCRRSRCRSSSAGPAAFSPCFCERVVDFLERLDQRVEGRIPVGRALAEHDRLRRQRHLLAERIAGLRLLARPARRGRRRRRGLAPTTARPMAIRPQRAQGAQTASKSPDPRRPPAAHRFISRRRPRLPAQSGSRRCAAAGAAPFFRHITLRGTRSSNERARRPRIREDERSRQRDRGGRHARRAGADRGRRSARRRAAGRRALRPDDGALPAAHAAAPTPMCASTTATARRRAPAATACAASPS